MDMDYEKLQRDNYKLKKENSDMRDFVAKKVSSPSAPRPTKK